MTGSTPPRFDVIVVGGGPGGSTAATLMAKAGHRVLLLEKERFPRFQIGESLLPSTVHGVCRLLGVTDALAEQQFPIKRGGTFRWGSNTEPWTFTFALSRRLAGPTSTAYQVDRARFDDILLKNARKHGVEVREGHEVLALQKADGRVSGVHYRADDGQEESLSAEYVVIASGNTGALHKDIAERVYSPFFQNIALFGYYEGGKRLPSPNSGNILCAAFKDGWFWYIPLSDTLTSVGAVVSSDRFPTVQLGREAAMREFIEACPLIADYLADATRVTEGMHGELRVRKDYSYHSTAFWGQGAVLVGDAACFVDPVFSTGVHLATYSGVLAARSVNTRLRGELTDEECFNEYEARYRREFNVYYQFLQTMYDLNRDESSYFWEARKLLDADVPNDEAFAELVAGVSGPDTEIFNMAVVRGFRTAFAQATSPESLDEGDIALQGSGTRLLGSVLQEATDLQMRATTTDAPTYLPAPKPLFEKGLAPSPDGLHWIRPTTNQNA